jgi:uncharacterized protein YndB with AHSA1/START domain
MKTDSAVKAGEFFGQVSGKTVETTSVWAEANQRVLGELRDFSVSAAKEGVRVYGELQQGAVEAVRDCQAAAMKWQASWQDGPNDPMDWYQKALVGTVDGAQKFFRLLEGNAQAVTRSAERLRASAEQAGKGIQETFETTVARMKDICIQS